MATMHGTTQAADGTVLHYETRGAPDPSRPSLVLLHYYGGSPRTWDALLARPALAGRHAVRYHARGWAPSTGPADPRAYGIAAMSADLAAVVAATGVATSGTSGTGGTGGAGGPGFVLVGHSMGAKVAQHYTATASAAARPAALVLVAPAPLRGLDFGAEARQQQLAAYQSADSVRFVLDNVLTAAPRTLSGAAAAQCVADSLRGSEAAKRAWPEYAVGKDYGELVKDIAVPVLVLRGDKDFERELVGRLDGPAATWVNKDIEGCGHLIPLEKPDVLAAEIAAFLEKTTPSR